MTHTPCDCGWSRRHFLTTSSLGSLALLLQSNNPTWANEAASGISPDEALQRLKDGNTRFVGLLKGDASCLPHLNSARLLETFQQGQHPFATVIGCSDSRVPIEEIFNQGVGDLFIVRIAGNVVHVDETGSAEYSVEHLGTPLIVVLGHTKCGAVTAVVKGDKVGENILKLVDNITPAVERSKAKKLQGDDLINDAIRENVQESINGLMHNSEDISKLVRQGKVKVAGAIYHIDSGQVEWL